MVLEERWVIEGRRAEERLFGEGGGEKAVAVSAVRGLRTEDSWSCDRIICGFERK